MDRCGGMTGGLRLCERRGGLTWQVCCVLLLVPIAQKTLCGLHDQFSDGAVLHQSLHFQAFVQIGGDIGCEAAVAVANGSRALRLRGFLRNRFTRGAIALARALLLFNSNEIDLFHGCCNEAGEDSRQITGKCCK